MCEIVEQDTTFLVVKPTSSFKSSHCFNCYLSNNVEIPPSTDLSPTSLPPVWGAVFRILPARREKGSDCSQTWPGPLTVAKKNPSPPKKADFTLLTNPMS